MALNTIEAGGSWREDAEVPARTVEALTGDPRRRSFACCL
jgi:hypothetical protein